jgi:putative transposase
VKFAFVREHRQRWPIRVICRVLQVSHSGFYAWRKRPPSARAVRQKELLEKIRVAHQENQELYGSPRVHRALLIDGQSVSRNTVARLMRQAKIRAKSRRRFVPRTTDSRHQKPVADNKLNRDFDAGAINRKWLADITYIPTGEGWLYLAAVLDCFSRRIVGWSMADHLETDLAADALKMALLQRAPLGRNLLHHSDRGVQYASEDYQQLLKERGIEMSMSGRGDCYDNAMMESFWATLKSERVHQRSYATREQARQSIFEYIEVFYNRKPRRPREQFHLASTECGEVQLCSLCRVAKRHRRRPK